jgi:hypothetical protein
VNLGIKWQALSLLSAGLMFGSGCGATIVDSLLVGSLSFFTAQVNSNLTQAPPLDVLITGLVRDAFIPG